MARNSLPEEWISGELNSLNVRDDLNLNSPVTNLYVYRSPIRKNTGKPRTKKLLCRWMPILEEDTRPNKGKNKSGKRLPLQGFTGMADVYDAGREAIAWVKQKKLDLIELAKENEYNPDCSLRHYWEIHFKNYQDKYINKRGGKKRCNSERSTWNCDVTGIGHQPFSDKSIDHISYADLNDYWKLIDQQGEREGSDMSQKKKAIVTLLNKLFVIAQESRDFENLIPPRYPVIQKWEKKEATYFERSEFENLLLILSSLAGDKVNQNLTHEEFLNVSWTNKDRKNERNFLEIYDAVMVMWYFYLRAEDMPRLRNEWFSIGLDADGEEVVKLNMREAKGGRDTKTSFPYRPEALPVFKRILKRRKEKGYFIFDWYTRPKNNPNSGQVGETLNYLLRYACERANIIKENIVWTSLRHTAFMETCRDYPQLSEVRELINFSENAYTSADMLRKNYLNKLDRAASSKRARTLIAEDTTANKTLQERYKEMATQIKNKEEITDKKFKEMDLAEGFNNRVVQKEYEVTKQRRKKEFEEKIRKLEEKNAS